MDTSLNIECAAAGTPPPQLHWLKNGLPLSVSSQIKLLSAGQILRLYFFSFNYLTFCSVSWYQHNSAVFLRARVKFDPNHAVIKVMCSMYSIFTACFNCFFLRLARVQVSDTGVYTCVASNRAGVHNKHYNLQVLGECL